MSHDAVWWEVERESGLLGRRAPETPRRFARGTRHDLQAPGKLPVAPAPVRRGALEGAHVLFIDDEVEQGLALCELLGDEGATGWVAPSGEAALAGLDRQVRPDLALIDLGLPGLRGAELIAALRRRVPGLPILVGTGYPSDHPSVTDALALGNNAYLSKPFDLAHLVDTMAHLLRPR